MNTAAVTGSRSMLGRSLCALLKERGVDVIEVGRHEGAEIRLDLSDSFTATQVTGADALFHCAASMEADTPEGVRKNQALNASGSLAVVELAEALGSSVLVNAGTLSSNSEFDPRGRNSYGLTKAHGEDLMNWHLSRSGGRFCSLRFPQLSDTQGDCIRHQPWYGRAIAYAAAGADVNLPASEGPRSFLHVDDAARLMIGVAKDGEVEGILNAVHPELVTVEELFQITYGVFDQGGEIHIAPEKPPFRKVNYPNTQSAFARLEWDAQISLEEGARRIREAGTASAFGALDVT